LAHQQRILCINAHATTQNPTQPNASAVGIEGGRIAFVGTNEEAKLWQKPSDCVIDCQQLTLLPGIIDSHFHLELGSESLDKINLSNVQTLEDLKQTILSYLHQHPQKSHLVGHGLLYSLPTRISLSRKHLDEFIADRPLILFAYDGHTAWANTCALAAAGLLHGKELPAGNEIVIGEDGTATGELREPQAYNPVLDLIPPLSASQKKSLIQQGCRLAHQFGITSVHNMSGSLDLLLLFAEMEKQGELTLRLLMPLSITPQTTLAEINAYLEASDNINRQKIHSRAAKFFMDGVIESYTGCLIEGYPQRPDLIPEAQYSLEEFIELARFCHQKGMQIFTHAVGDGAVRRTLDGYAAIQAELPQPNLHHRIEHIEVIHPQDLPRFEALGVIPSMQPLHCPPSAQGVDIWTERVGKERWKYSFAWKTIRSAAKRLIFGSDWPVVSLNPFLGFEAALSRKPWQDGDPEQKQSIQEIISSYTIDAAYAENQTLQKGMIKEGMLADLVLLSQDIFALPTEEIGKVVPVLTICNGEVVYKA